MSSDTLPVPAGDSELQPTVKGEVYETSFDYELDAEPSRGGMPVDQPDKLTPVRRPIVPVHLRTLPGLRKAVQDTAAVTLYRAGYHALRLPLIYLPLAVFWAVVGVFFILGRAIRWWWAPELSALLQKAASDGDIKGGVLINRPLGAARSFRGTVLLVTLGALATGVVLLVHYGPAWAQLLAVAVLVPWVAHYGRPADHPIISAAVVTPRHRRLNPDIVLRAYYAAGLGHPDKDQQQVTFLSQMARDRYNTGSQVLVALPHGTTFSEAMKAREKLASGLDVSLSQVYLTRDKTSNRSHWLYVADDDPLSIPAGRTPLLDCKPRDIWKPAPLGVDERNRRVAIPLVFYSMLVGGQPRRGKSFTARALALFAALDPYVRLSVFDASGKPDWRKFALVAHTCGFGLLPDRIQGDPVENLRATLRAAKREVLERNARLSELPVNVCPEGKLTREIARDPRYRMPVWVITLDEFQLFLATGDEEADREIAELLVFLIKVAPSVGIVLVSATQRPSGLGSTGKIQKLFIDFRDNHLTRFALKTGSWQVSDFVLGAGAYSEGFDSSALPVGDEYRGVGILYDAPVDNATVRTYLADAQDAEKILHAARRLRERAGTLDGMAAGETVAAQARDPLADALDAFGGDETFLAWKTLAARLAEQMPERYADLTQRALSDTLTGLGLGIESKVGKEKGAGDERARGAYRSALDRAIKARGDGDR